MADSPAGITPEPGDIKRSYVRVVIVWLVTLAALYAFQEFFQ